MEDDGWREGEGCVGGHDTESTDMVQLHVVCCVLCGTLCVELRTACCWNLGSAEKPRDITELIFGPGDRRAISTASRPPMTPASQQRCHPSLAPPALPSFSCGDLACEWSLTCARLSRQLRLVRSSGPENERRDKKTSNPREACIRPTGACTRLAALARGGKS